MHALDPHLRGDLIHWITERYSIKLRRAAGAPPPWTHDPIMSTVRWCNVHREDDKVTQWMRENWNRTGDPAWRFVLGRMVNLPSTLAVLGGADMDTCMAEMKALRHAGHKVWTSAYTISTCGKNMDKIDYVFDWVVAAVAQAGDPDYESCATAFENLQNIDGLGSFLAAQVVADMKNTVGHPLYTAPDWWSFSAPGPGSLRGLSWYFYKQPTGVTPRTYQDFLKTCRAEVDDLLPDWVPTISNQDFQNCLCEFSKYCKVKYLNGRIRNRYVPNSNS